MPLRAKSRPNSMRLCPRLGMSFILRVPSQRHEQRGPATASTRIIMMRFMCEGRASEEDDRREELIDGRADENLRPTHRRRTKSER